MLTMDEAEGPHRRPVWASIWHPLHGGELGGGRPGAALDAAAARPVHSSSGEAQPEPLRRILVTLEASGRRRGLVDEEMGRGSREESVI
jgi:hypothetical protein